VAAVITTENLGIEFYRSRRRKLSLREMLFRQGATHSPETFWALRGVTLQVHPGEAVGLVGANGGEDRIASLSRMIGSASTKVGKAEEGDTLAFGRLDHIASGETIGEAKAGKPQQISGRPPTPQPVHALSLAIRDRKDEVKLAAAMAKLTEEDSSLIFTQDQESGEMKLAGQGEMHLRVALERLSARFGVTVEAKKSGVAYRETIRHTAHVRGRHKKQSGGHGQFGDVVLDVRPQPRGEGFLFEEKVHGGSVPRQYFSSVEAGCRDACVHGPLGFPVVDVAVTLVDGSYHTVDSSDMAFRTAARIGMQEALEKSGPVLLEPILAVSIAVPTEAMSRATAIVSGRRGQILGFDGNDRRARPRGQARQRAEDGRPPGEDRRACS
jgi:elongation factor G